MTTTQELILKGEKTDVLNSIEKHLEGLGFKIISKDLQRPWGGFFVLDESQAEKFAALYFPGIEVKSMRIGGKLSPKILVVQAQKRLSWQYHHRRAEIWKLILGTAGVVTSETDQLGPLKKLEVNEIIRLHQGLRHRLVGLDGWGMVAEMWQHTDALKPSDENDIVRVQDDFGRRA
jgi:mannose-6-phosphate isomerase